MVPLCTPYLIHGSLSSYESASPLPIDISVGSASYVTLPCHIGHVSYDLSVVIVYVLTVASRSVCSPECTDDGCWGPGDAQCLACQNYRYGNRCLPSCDVETGLFVVANGNGSAGGMRQCGRCHQECLGSCRKEVTPCCCCLCVVTSSILIVIDH